MAGTSTAMTVREDRVARLSSEWVHEGKYAARVEIELEDSDEPWSPTMSPGDAHKLDRVCLALRRGDIAEGLPRRRRCSSCYRWRGEAADWGHRPRIKQCSKACLR